MRENLDTDMCQPNRDYVYFLVSSRLDGGDFASIDKDLKIINVNDLFKLNHTTVYEMQKMLVDI